MNNNLERIKEKFDKGEIALGTTVSLTDPEISEILGSCGFDFIWIDSEHGPLDKNIVNMHIMAARGAGTAPFVRVPWNDPVLVKPVLDMGPAGIIFPYIRTVKEAELAVSSCKYPPRGVRGFGPRRANNYSNMDPEDYFKISRAEPWVMIQIEHVDGVNNLAEILKIDGIDMIVIGPNDLSGSIGLLGQINHPEVVKLLDQISIICREAGMRFFPATGYGSIEGLSEWIKRGACMLAMDWDIGHIVSGGKRAIESAIEAIERFRGN